MIANLLIGLLIIGINVTIHGYGTKHWVSRIHRKHPNFSTYNFDNKSVWIVIYTAAFLIILSFIEAVIWAFTYYLLPGVTEFESIEKSVYFSLVTYTTLGYGDITISTTNRLLSGFEAMNGILLLGWSTTIMFSIMQDLLKNTFNEQDN